jgi:hypothetical protein
MLIKNVDSDDHMSHVAYLSDMDNGECPSTHPITLVKLLYEVSKFIILGADQRSN